MGAVWDAAADDTSIEMRAMPPRPARAIWEYVELKEVEPDSVVVLIPYKLHVPLWWSVRLYRMIQNAGMDVGILGSQLPAVDVARDRLVEQAMEMGYKTALWIDSDVIAPEDAFHRLITRYQVQGEDMPFVSGVYYARRSDILVPNVWTLAKECPACLALWEPDKLACGRCHADLTAIGEYLRHLPLAKQQTFADAVGLGLCRVDLDLYRRLDPPWHFLANRFRKLAEEGRLPEWIRPNLYKDLPVSEDFYFCLRVRKQLHEKILVLGDLRARHAIAMSYIDENGQLLVGIG